MGVVSVRCLVIVTREPVRGTDSLDDLPGVVLTLPTGDVSIARVKNVVS